MDKCKGVYVESVPWSELAMHMGVNGNPALILGHTKHGGVVAKVRNHEGKEWVTWGGKNELASPDYNEAIDSDTQFIETTSDETRIMMECQDVPISENKKQYVTLCGTEFENKAIQAHGIAVDARNAAQVEYDNLLGNPPMASSCDVHKAQGDTEMWNVCRKAQLEQWESKKASAKRRAEEYTKQEEAKQMNVIVHKEKGAGFHRSKDSPF